MAYPLDLDPHANLSSRLPAPVLANVSLSLTFPVAANGVTYTVETSRDLKTWTTAEVMTTPMDGGRRRASIPLDEGRSSFLRRVVSASSVR